MLRHTAASARRPFSRLPQGALSMVWPRSPHQALAMPSMSSAAHSTNIKGFQKLNLSAKCAPASWPGAFLLSSSLPRLPICYPLQALLHRWLAHKNTGKPVLPPGRSSLPSRPEPFHRQLTGAQRSAFRLPGESGRSKAGHPPFQTGTDVLL